MREFSISNTFMFHASYCLLIVSGEKNTFTKSHVDSRGKKGIYGQSSAQKAISPEEGKECHHATGRSCEPVRVDGFSTQLDRLQVGINQELNLLPVARGLIFYFIFPAKGDPKAQLIPSAAMLKSLTNTTAKCFSAKVTA